MSNIDYTVIKTVDEIEILRNKSSFNYTFDQTTIETLKKYFSLKGSLYIIVKNNEKFVGFCSTDRDWWEENYFFVREILIDPDFQKQNIGSELIGRCIDHAKKNRAIGVVTETAFDNAPMQALCEKFGFQKWNNPKWGQGITYKLTF